MRIIHTADWHIGNNFYDHDRSAEHRDFLDFLLRAIHDHEADALVIAGDVFDNPNPSAAAQKLYYDFLGKASEQNPGLQIVVTAGNHDSGMRLEAARTLLEGRKIYIRGFLHTEEGDSAMLDDLLIPLHSRRNPDDEVICIAVPFLRSSDLPVEDSFSRSMGRFFSNIISEARHRYGKDERMIMAAHFYATGSEINAKEHSERIIVGGEENVDASQFASGLSYIALGHIHKAQRIGGNELIRYSGSALPMSFGERGYSHGINIVDIAEDGSVTVTTESRELLRPLLTIPSRGATTVEGALERIESLPAATEGDDNTRWPYVEVILSKRPDAAGIHRLKESFSSRAALLCVIRTAEDLSAAHDAVEVRTEEQLRKLNPLELMRKIYSDANGGEKMPEALENKFNTAVRIASQQNDND